MKIFTKSTFLLLLFITTFSIPSNAVIDYKPDADKKTTIVNKHKKAKKKGLFKRWKEKFILKKFKKLQKKIDKTSINKRAKISLILGVGSFFMLILSVLSGLLVGFIALAGLSALVGDFISISTLKKTKDSKEEYRKERRTAKWGLAFSLLTGLLPLLALLILLMAW